jgi:phenylalanyl-tRNA synthetase alpha chain
MMDKLESIRDLARSKISEASSDEELEQVRIEFLGRKGKLTEVLRNLGALSIEEKKTLGAEANNLKRELLELIEEKRTGIREDSGGGSRAIDYTLPGRTLRIGRPHIVRSVTAELERIFLSFGFSVVHGPDIEDDYHNFTALNIPEDHPARDLHDTFYIEGMDLLLRTHTSPMQIRVMEKKAPPIRIVVPGRCYRNERTDASHLSEFHQMEGLYVDKGVNFGQLKGVLTTFARACFGENTDVRLRPGYFPFTEPSAEVDIGCPICGGKGCSVCKQTGWVEILGSDSSR